MIEIAIANYRTPAVPWLNSTPQTVTECRPYIVAMPAGRGGRQTYRDFAYNHKYV